jgi:DNA-binding CsgD family transcriptional regulator
MSASHPHRHEPAAPLRDAVRSSSLAIALIHLPTRRFVELSPRAEALLGPGSPVLRGTDALAISQEPDASSRAFEVIADGVLDGYHARRRLRGGDGAIDSRIWVRVLRRTAANADAIVIVTPVHNETDGVPLDGAAVAESVGSVHEDRPGQESLEYLIVPLLDVVHPDDIATILTVIEEVTADGSQAAFVVRVRGEAGSWQRLRLSLGPIDDATQQLGFALTRAGETPAGAARGERLIELEQRLRRIAREVEDAGLHGASRRAPDPASLPGLEDLTSRQLEVANRLVWGERVSEIARNMYLSPSTVRNHLANLFRKVGVHSQSEFLDLLRPQD